MAKNFRLSPNVLAMERTYFDNLKAIPGYTSLNPQFSVSTMQGILDELDLALAEEARLTARIAEVRDVIAAQGTALVKCNDGAVQQVVALFGDDSPEYQSLGRRRRSDRRKSASRSAKLKKDPAG